MKKLILGLDLGITSVGWGIIDEEYNIIKSGVRLFNESTADGNIKRREFRSSRRLISRRKLRKSELKELLIKNKIINDKFKNLPNPYDLRIKGLSEKLSNSELATALLHIAKRRGSSLEVIEDEKESKNELSPKNILKNNEKLLKNNFVSQIQKNRLIIEGRIRGFKNVFKTDDYIKETRKILSNQNLDSDLEENIIELISRRRHFSEGPGNFNSPSKYGRFREIEGDLRKNILEEIGNNYKNKYKQERFVMDFNGKKYNVLKNGMIINANPLNLIDLMRGKCSLYKNEFRAPKMSFSAELFNLLNDLNNISINNRENQKLTINEKNEIISIIRENGDFKPAGIKGLLKILNNRDNKIDDSDISGARIDAKGNKIITELKCYKKILKIYKELNLEVANDDVLDEIAEILTKTLVFDERIIELSKIIKETELIERISNLPGFNGYHSLSLKAIKLLNNEMIEENLNQQQIITNLSLKQVDRIDKLVLNDELILSPVAKRVHREALKVVSELIKEFGNFDRIVIETTRAKNTQDQKDQIKKNIKRNEQSKAKVLVLISNEGYNPEKISGLLAQKIRLRDEQDCKCAYTGLEIDLATLIRDPKFYEIDHIIPFSISADNSQSNKVLVVSSVNQLKKNKTPFAYFQTGNFKNEYKVKDFETFSTLVNSNVSYGAKKRHNLLFAKDIGKYENIKEFTNRNLIDTSYAIRSFMTTLKNYFESNEIKTNVFTIKGKQTNLFRGIAVSQWYKDHPNSDNNPLLIDQESNIEKNRSEYIHHSIDALIIAGLSNQKMFKYIYDKNLTESKKDVYDENTGEIIEHNPIEDGQLIKFLKSLANVKEEDTNFSWKIDSKPNRGFSDQTIYSTRKIDGVDKVIKKIGSIYTLKSDEIKKKIIDDKENLFMYINDERSYQLLENIYNQYSHEKYPFGAYQKENNQKIRKYAKNGKGPEITSLKQISGKLGEHQDISKLYDSKNGKKIVKLSISAYRIDIYKNSKNEYEVNPKSWTNKY